MENLVKIQNELKQVWVEAYIGQGLVHDYNLTANEKELNLTNLIHNEKESILKNTGDLILWYDRDGQEYAFDYTDAEQLLILLTENNKTKIEFRQSITLKTI